MVSSPMYERLKTFMEAARANKGLEAWDRDHEKALEYFDDAVERLRSYRDGHGFTGATGTAMDRWVDASVQRITKYREAYERGFRSYSNGRGVMATALAEGEKISADLIDAETEAMRDDWVVSVPDSEPGPGIRAMGKLYTTGAAYVEAVEAQANAQREAAAERILTMLNSSTKAISVEMEGRPNSAEPGKGLEDYEEEEHQKENNAGSGGGNRSDSHTAGRGAGGWGYSRDDDFGRAADRSSASGNYPGGFDQPWWSEADAAAARRRIVSSGAVETRELPYGELGSRTNPITDPQELMSRDLLHTRVNGTTYRNGVLGGHTPAPPADVDHPLWRLNGGPASDSATAGRLGGAGVLGAGVLGVRGAVRMGSGSFGESGSATGLSGAGRMGAAGMRGITGTTNGMGGAGVSALKVGSYSGSGFGSYTPPAGSAGSMGATGAGGANGAAGTSGVTGTTGANGGGAGATGKGGSTSGGFMGAGAGAGTGAGKDDKKARRRQYVAFRFEDDDDSLPAGYVNPMSQTYGTDKDIAPARRTDDGWDPRQW